jgi:hypothetical protein
VSITSAIVGTWFLSYEEDTADTRVYRPADFAFPPARGRPGMAFGADGTYLEIGPGADDRGSAQPGRWRELAPGQIEISFPGTERPPSVRRVLSVEGGVLKIAK